jgi:type I restriction-modification system DNA methylase subunit
VKALDGDKILSTLSDILDWCRSKARMQVPGEGGERPLRSRLCEAFLEKLLGWPPDFILSGERFDICLLNPQDQPVVTIETKEPGHITTEAEYKTFLGRLRHYPSLRHAYVTNGSYWERFDIHAPLTDREEITLGHFEEVGRAEAPALFEDLAVGHKAGKHHELALNNASAPRAQEFFAPLEPALYLDLTRPLEPGTHRHRLTRDKPHFIESFSGALRDQIADFRQLFCDTFNGFRTGNVGTDVTAVCRASFQLWCERSYVAPPESLHKRVETLLATEDGSADKLVRLFTTEFGFPKEPAIGVAESLYAEYKKKKSTPEKRMDLLWPLYDQAMRNYATQTAHVYVARLLLYRIGEDQQIFDEKISGQALQPILAPVESPTRITPRSEPLSVSVVESLRAEMAGFAPSVYESGEFDWWRVVHREVLTQGELERLQSFEDQMAVANQRILRLLSVYDLGAVDLDIWRDIYQHYLPEEERQQLGGFYTPQELVDLTLDYANYKSGTEKLCQKSLIDLASGSGAFVVSALQRLLLHLNDKAQTCHASLHARDITDWERAHSILQTVARNIHAIDIHPFAAFLTYINFLFVVLPVYAQVRRQRKTFRLDVAIFASNSLLTPGENAGQRELDLPVNSRILASRQARERYREMAGHRFDFVVGNPPWGGILKGRLAPIFDEHYKTQLSGEYPDTYTGKLDIYALFYDRALKWLKSGGTVALVTQGSFIDKDWASPHTEYVRGRPVEVIGLRRKLAEQASLRYLIDLNPFGQLFFGAMNIPCIGVFEKRPAYKDEKAVVLLCSKKSWPKAMGKPTRRGEVVAVVRRCLELVEKSGDPLKQDFVSAFQFPLARLREYGGGRWLLAPKEFKIQTRPEWPRIAQLLEPRQGVTVGGEGCLSIFLMSEARAKELALEEPLVHRIIKGQETVAWRPEWGANVILYPYHEDKEGRWRPAFTCKKPPVLDALDFEHCADKFEQDWVRQYGRNSITYKRLFEHRRDALEIVKYPRAAEYLLSHYEQLAGRTFEKRSIFDWGKEWYEFHRPRDAEIIFGQPKIISPRLTPRVRFALDQEGIGIQDSCLCLAVAENTKEGFNEFRKRLSKVLGHEVKAVTVFRYLLAFLNSSYAQELLTTGHRPRPGDVFQVSDQFLEEISIPVCRTKRELQKLLEAVDACMLARTEKALAPAESHLNSLVLALYSAH